MLTDTPETQSIDFRWEDIQDQILNGWCVARAVKIKQGKWEGAALILANGAFPWGIESIEKLMELTQDISMTDGYFFVQIKKEFP